MQIFVLKSFAKTIPKLHDLIGRESHVIAVQPPLAGQYQLVYTRSWTITNPEF